MKLNLGGGDTVIPGYENVDRKFGWEAYPLTRYAPNSIEEIRASHILEHFSYRSVPNVISDWVSRLKPGGVLKIAVPNFAWIVNRYQALAPIPLQAYLMGGHDDENDYHKSIFDEALLHELLTEAGLVDVQPWKSEIEDCAALEVSLNLQGTKPNQAQIDQEKHDAPYANYLGNGQS